MGAACWKRAEELLRCDIVDLVLVLGNVFLNLFDFDLVLKCVLKFNFLPAQVG